MSLLCPVAQVLIHLQWVSAYKLIGIGVTQQQQVFCSGGANVRQVRELLQIFSINLGGIHDDELGS
jgi:hypothetical protein